MTADGARELGAVSAPLAAVRAKGTGQDLPADKAEAFVFGNSSLRPVQLVPEIRLYLADDAFSVWEAAERETAQRQAAQREAAAREAAGREAAGRELAELDCRERDVVLAELPPPFWAFAWPGGQALARYVLDHPEIVAGRPVLDVGSGSGVAAIAAGLAGASRVVASEVDPFAAAAIRLNAAANRVRVDVTGDVLDGAGEDAAVILAADVWYERQLADRAITLIRHASDRGADVLVGDIGRAFLPRPMLRELAAYDVPVLAELENTSVKRVLILTLL